MDKEQIAKMQAGRRANHALLAESTLSYTADQKETLERVRMYCPSAVNVFLKAFNKRSMAAAVKAKCIECTNLQKAEVTRCTISGCPLWRYRPYQRDAVVESET